MSTTSLLQLWSHACSALSHLRSSLYPLDTYLAAELRALRRHLRALEFFCRRLALTEALALLGREPSMSAGARRAKPEDPHRPLTSEAGPEAHGPRKSKRLPRLRLWPKPPRLRARITLLGPPTSMREIWREQKRAALVAQLKRARSAASRGSCMTRRSLHSDSP